jgi:hypothetical protein
MREVRVYAMFDAARRVSTDRRVVSEGLDLQEVHPYRRGVALFHHRQLLGLPRPAVRHRP